MIDRTAWGPGPWDGEPDEKDWVHEGYKCAATRSWAGSWHGSVRIPGGHPLHGKPYDDPGILDLDVHGGISFAEDCDKHGYLIGFDCMHSRDYVPKVIAQLKACDPTFIERQAFFEFYDPAHYKTLAFVIAQCEALVEQLRSLE